MSRPFSLGTAIHVDEIEPRTNIVQQQDLTTVLKLTPPDRRILVALAFLGWTQEEWGHSVNIHPKTVWTWTCGANRMPYGGALRLSRVMGVSTDLLFEHWQ